MLITTNIVKSQYWGTVECQLKKKKNEDSVRREQSIFKMCGRVQFLKWPKAWSNLWILITNQQYLTFLLKALFFIPISSIFMIVSFQKDCGLKFGNLNTKLYYVPLSKATRIWAKRFELTLEGLVYILSCLGDS